MNCRCRFSKLPVTTCTNICCCSVSIEPVKECFIEPIYAAYIKKPDSKVIHCISNKCYNCLKEYFEKSLQQSYSQIFRNQREKLEMGRSIAIVSSPNITINDDQIMNMQNDAIKKVQQDKNEIRKRYAIMQMDDCVFILGGYVVNQETEEKETPKHDYLYDNNTKELTLLPPLPGNCRMGFGLAATYDDKIICVGGHDFNYKTLSNVDILDIHADKFKWLSLPNMPNGAIGPGVSVVDNILYVIGGFDFVGHEILCNGDVLFMDLKKHKWNTLTDLDPPRARPLVSVIENTDPPSLIVAGGYNFDHKGKSVPYGKIEEYNIKKKKWTTIADIPDFKKTSGLATRNNKLFLMDTVVETGESHIIKEYDLETRKWQSSRGMGEAPIFNDDISETAIEVTKTE